MNMTFSMTPAVLGHGLLVILGATAACALVVFLIHRCFPVSAELSRKLLHLSVIVVMSAWLYAFPLWTQAELTMAVFVAVVYVLLVLLEKLPVFSFFAKATAERSPGELRKSLCAVGFMFMLMAALGWGWLGERRLALAAIFAWGPGDAAAALIGKRWGRTKLGRAKKKSLEGSSAMFTLSFLSVLIILLTSSAFPLGQALPASLLTAAASAVVEFADLSGFDTLFCPAAAMAVLCLARLVWPQMGG